MDYQADVLTPTEVQALLRVGRTVLYRWLREGKIKSFRNGRRFLIPREAVAKFLDQQLFAADERGDSFG